MPRSMTAFASAEAQHDWGTISWEIRSINHRYLEPSFRLPDALHELEMPLRDQTSKILQRGKLDCTLRFEPKNSLNGIEIDTDLAQKYINAGEAIAQLITNPAPIYPLDVLAKPGIQIDTAIDRELLKSATIALYQQVLDRLVEARLREGDKLAEVVQKRLAEISLHITSVRTAMPELLAAQRQKLVDKLAEFGDQLHWDRLEQELVYIAQKADVDEELDRLQVHVAEVHRILKNDKTMGRRLDFLAQELNREANTLCSKSMASSSTQSAVEIKVLIEQIREQIQNLE